MNVCQVQSYREGAVGRPKQCPDWLRANACVLLTRKPNDYTQLSRYMVEGDVWWWLPCLLRIAGFDFCGKHVNGNEYDDS